jgi:hypothetical protein
MGHLLDEKLVEMFGDEVRGEIFFTKQDLIVERTELDAVGGFRLFFSGGYVLSTFPATEVSMAWHLSRSRGGFAGLMNGVLSVKDAEGAT